MPEIRKGIVWQDDEEDLTAECARCGGSVEWLDCWYCGGRGLTHHDCGEDSCCCLHPEDNVSCIVCKEECGAWHCTNTPEFCAANPLPGCENVESTALKSEVWLEA